MELTREIYWNVGHGLGTLIPMYVLSLAALGVVVWGFLKRIRVYAQGQPLQRTDAIRERVARMLKNVLLQSKVLRVKGPGIAHALFFWGIFLLFLGTCLTVVQADFTDLLFGFKFLKGPFYLIFSLVLDLAGLVTIVMLGGLLVRRFLVRPAGLETKSDDVIMHGLLFAILISGFVIEGARMAVTELGTPLAVWSPVGLMFAKVFAGSDAASLRTLHSATWWLHLLLVMGFIVTIPFTKFRHIVTTSLNYFFADLGPTGKLVTINLEDEKVEHFGASKVKDLTWKDIFDADACTQCKRCQDRCPAHMTKKPLSPMQLVNRIGTVAFHSPEANLIEACDKDAIWSCTTCRACQEICPAGIEHVNKVVDIRRHQVLMEGVFPGQEVMTAMEQTEVNSNPLGMAFAGRGDWAQALGVKSLAEDPVVDLLYFVGCYASFDQRNIKVATSFIRLCQAAGLKVGILGKEEKCCGEPLRKLGNEYLYQSLASENIATIQGYGVRQIVTTCPHCFNTLAKDYLDIGLQVTVEHHTTFLARLLERGELKLVPEKKFACTYHDSCYLGRYNDIYTAPRILIAAAGGQLTEMERHGAESFCCGAGGGRILAEEKLGSRINSARTQMAAATGTGLLVSNCPFCLTMFEDGIKGEGLEGSLAPLDIAELLAERLLL
jgi:Fe-S oxidoreductase/nitrate reductase gamma subunit